VVEPDEPEDCEPVVDDEPADGPGGCTVGYRAAVESDEDGAADCEPGEPDNEEPTDELVGCAVGSGAAVVGATGTTGGTVSGPSTPRTTGVAAIG
jgi:hypothetical protein